MMLSSEKIGRHRRTTGFACLMAVAATLLCVCTVQRPPVPLGTVPKMDLVSLEDQDYGEGLFLTLRKKHAPVLEDQRQNHVLAIFENLLTSANADAFPWQLHLFDSPDIVDVRAVHGNHVFVWSGLLDLARNDAEVAGLLACEIAHVLARHTAPVEFNVVSNILFEITSVAATVGIMAASQGTVAIGGSSWFKSLYVDAIDLDSLDRKYDPQLEREAATIALVILARSDYAPDGLFQFWQRVADDATLTRETRRLARGIPPEKRSAMLAELMLLLPTWVPTKEEPAVATVQAPVFFLVP